MRSAAPVCLLLGIALLVNGWAGCVPDVREGLPAEGVAFVSSGGKTVLMGHNHYAPSMRLDCMRCMSLFASAERANAFRREAVIAYRGLEARLNELEHGASIAAETS